MDPPFSRPSQPPHDSNNPPLPPPPPEQQQQQLKSLIPPSASPSGGIPSTSNPPSAVVPSRMRRPSLGKIGRHIEVLCNHFRVLYKSTQDVYHYNVTIEQKGFKSEGKERTNKGVSRRILQKVQEVYGSTEFKDKKFAFDGEKSLFTVGPLGFQTQEFSVFLEEDRVAYAGQDDDSRKKRRTSSDREFKVTIEFAAQINMRSIDALLRGERSEKAQDALRVLDIVLRQHAARRGYILIRENYFSPTFGVADIGGGVQTCQGFHVSFRPTLQGLSLNLDIATTTIIKPCSVLEFIREHFEFPHPMSVEWEKVKRVLKGVKVQTPHTKMVHRIIGVSNEPCSQLRFSKKKRDDAGNTEEIEITVAEYYKMQYNITLQYPSLPCLETGRAKRPTYVPVELCFIVEGQRYIKSLTSSQRQKMIDQARQTPDQRKFVVQEAMKRSMYNNDDLIRDFNISIDQRMSTVAGRLLDAPSLRFHSFDEMPRNGRWNFNNKVMAVGAKISNWVVLNFDSRLREPDAKKTVMELVNVCKKKGMNVNNPAGYFGEPFNPQRLSPVERVNNMIDQLKKELKGPPEFMLCILPVKKNSDLYAPLKKLLQTKMAISSQCIAPPRQVKDQYLTNVALKMNAKIGGYNSWLALEHEKKLPKVSSTPTIIFGMDVSHGSPGHADSPSIAAVVASREWPMISKYGVRIRAQSPKVEMIEGLYEERGRGGMIAELLREFYDTCQPFPDRRPKQFIIFRDGVSESQFDQVLAVELQAVKKACAFIDKSGKYEPKITLIVAQKKHHTRFFPASSNGNVTPGTVIDAGICHPRDNDFYLCAHAGIIGTTRPTHYHVLLDENNFTVDELQQLTHFLCYTYARSTTAVSVVAPVAYAHLAATHVRNFIDSDGGSDTSSRSGRMERLVSTQLPELHDKMKEKMFYC